MDKYYILLSRYSINEYTSIYQPPLKRNNDNSNTYKINEKYFIPDNCETISIYDLKLSDYDIMKFIEDYYVMCYMDQKINIIDDLKEFEQRLLKVIKKVTTH